MLQESTFWKEFVCKVVRTYLQSAFCLALPLELETAKGIHISLGFFGSFLWCHEILQHRNSSRSVPVPSKKGLDGQAIDYKSKKALATLHILLKYHPTSSSQQLTWKRWDIHLEVLRHDDHTEHRHEKVAQREQPDMLQGTLISKSFHLYFYPVTKKPLFILRK